MTTPNPSRSAHVGFIVLGILLIGSAILPFCDLNRWSGKVEYISILRVLDDQSVPGTVKAIVIAPFLIGLAAIVLGAAARGLGRAIPMTIASALPIVVGVAFVGASANELSRLGLDLGAVVPLLLLSIGAFSGIYVACRSALFAPTGLAVPVAGGIGAGAYLLMLLMPMHSDMGGIGLTTPFRILALGHEWTAIAILVQMGTIVASSVLCIVMAARVSLRPTLARTAFTLLIGGSIVGVLPFLIGSFVEAAHAQHSDAVATVLLLTWLKAGLLMTSVLLLIPMSLTDLVAAVSAGNERVARPDPTDRLTQLTRLHEDGLITADELAQKRAELLDEL